MIGRRRNKLISKRKTQGYTQMEAAEKLGCSRAHYASIEVGLKNPGFDLTERIIEVFGIDVRDWR
ncbi:helix-turn-helix transcriptional regulator [Rossellomorea sp. BNER]|uniref:helix-turn-helix transcriptional regulator n=1 Tax=Rossellomorea sp. BNER TaxID=2962031 RepID=UPI003AF26B03|nr:helix-turn-helix transcriptional regulator [Rossellomorea sp. BNER]